jgi:hypothetical protein
MRIWDIPVAELCRAHLLGEHRELHAIWSIYSNNKTGYRNHPEVKRWRGHLGALALRHAAQINEMKKRGYNHLSDVTYLLINDDQTPPPPITPIDEQRAHLLAKACGCCKED